MKIRFPIWLVCGLIALFAIPTEAFAQARRPPPPGARERARERREDIREKREDRRERREDARDRRDHVRDRVDHRRHDIRARQWREAAMRRDRLYRERRLAARRDLAAWRRLRADRALARRRAIYARWHWAVQTPEGRAEFVLYGDRMARLHRIRDIADERRDNAMIVRVDRVIELENSRHANVIAVIISKR